MGVLDEIVRLNDEELTPVGHKFFRRQAGRRYTEHDAEGHLLVEALSPLPQVLAAVLHQLHGFVPVFQIGHHREHHPQRAVCRRTEQGTDLGLELMGAAQAAADAPQAQLGGLRPLMGVGHGAVCAKIKGAHRDHPALCRRQAGVIEHILLLLVHRAARQHHVTAAQQTYAGRAGQPRRFDVLLPETVGQQLKRLAVLRPARQRADAVHLLVLPLLLADAGHRLLAGDGIRVEDALAVVGIQDGRAAVAVVQKIAAHLHDAGDVHGPRNDGRMALLVAFCRDDAQDHSGGHTEQVARHEHLCRQDDGVVQRQPDAGAVGQDVHHAAGGIEDVHAAQLHIGVVFHLGQLVGIAAAGPVYGFGCTDARLDLEPDFVHEALVLQHHALEQEDGLFGGAAALSHRVQLGLCRLDGPVQQPLFPIRVERPCAEALDPALHTAHLPQHQAGRGGISLIDFHSSVTSVGAGAVSVRKTSACRNVLGSSAAHAACAAFPLPSNSGSNPSMRVRSQVSRKAFASVSTV